MTINKYLKYFLLVLIVLLGACLMIGCSKISVEGDNNLNTPTQTNLNIPTPTNINDDKQISKLKQIESTGRYIADVYTDKSAYQLNDKPKLFLELKNSGTEAVTGKIKLYVKKLAQTVDEHCSDISLDAQQAITVDFQLTLPLVDYTGYAVEVYLYNNDDELLDYDMSAVDVSSDWSRFPRYSYITNIEERTQEESKEILDRLRKHHINGLFYYDIIDRHDKPLAGTRDNPAKEWKTLAYHNASYDTLNTMIQIGHEYNIKSFVYNLIFGAYDNYEENGVKKEWGLFKDKLHNEQDAHDLSSLNWETKKLWIFNPANKNWQDYYLDVHKDFLAVYDFDGIQVDSLGHRGDLYDYDGNKVALNETYSALLNRIRDELNTKVIFNPVSGYGLKQMLDEVDYDVAYMEVWPGEYKTYNSLKAALDKIYRSTKGERGSVLAAYMNYKKRQHQGGSFNTAGVNFTNAVIMASGGSHLELGDTGMLSSEYYPGNTLKIGEQLEKDLRNYYTFMVAYENCLRGPGLEEVTTRTYLNDDLCSYDSELGRIWSFTKLNRQEEIELVHLINLKTANSVEWVDEMGTQKEPEVVSAAQVKHYVTLEPKAVYVASPDYHEGVLEAVDFTAGSDEKGTYVTFQLPYLKYWTMVVIQK